jgi:hypothetical protein
MLNILDEVLADRSTHQSASGRASARDLPNRVKVFPLKASVKLVGAFSGREEETADDRTQSSALDG